MESPINLEFGRSQDPNVPRIKISEACRRQVMPLERAFELLIDGLYPPHGLAGLGGTLSSMKSAKTEIDRAQQADILSVEDAVAIINLLQPFMPPRFPITPEEGEKLIDSLKLASTLVLGSLLDAAVDCECREAKAACEQLSNPALQRVLEPGEEGGGRPRRWTELTGENGGHDV